MTQHLSALDVLETHKFELCVVHFVKCQGKCCLLPRDFSVIFLQTFCRKHQINPECTFNAEHFCSAEHCFFLFLIVLSYPILMGIKMYLKDRSPKWTGCKKPYSQFVLRISQSSFSATAAAWVWDEVSICTLFSKSWVDPTAEQLLASPAALKNMSVNR